jgi:NAD(P)-dependent dehydrogenase (short-subunit alcohol dehydrogenase family)
MPAPTSPGVSRPGPDDIHAQTLAYPASQADLDPPPQSDLARYRPAGKLDGKVALITGGDSGIGRAVALAYALEGARVAILNDQRADDAAETKRLVEARGGECLTILADVRRIADCERAVAETVAAYGRLDVLVNNAAYQKMQRRFEDVTPEQFARTVETNLYGPFYMTRAAMPHLGPGACIVNTGSIIGKTGKEFLIDYTASKGALHTFTQSLALMLAERGIRVNAVVPGATWTPNIPATMDPDMVEGYDSDNALGRAGQPEELAPAFVFLASEDASYVTGALWDVTGGQLSA